MGQSRPNKSALNEEAERMILDLLVSRATSILSDQGVLDNLKRLKPICITQPHRCKKEILFTNMIFLLALAKAQDVSFIWSSDSDSWIYPGALEEAVGSIAIDEAIGGSSLALKVHNQDESYIAKLVAAHYSADLYLSRGQLSAFDVTDCQPGPSAVFRRYALEPILVPWYLQTFLGFRPVCRLLYCQIFY